MRAEARSLPKRASAFPSRELPSIPLFSDPSHRGDSRSTRDSCDVIWEAGCSRSRWMILRFESNLKYDWMLRI